ncbi:unnamed protein product [Fraxinus pennsylvanica]|uniref:Uncharacterized protein n=1 Tax=Fraxinus pennsylvanica TaxID=56036 RepID=A0AAD1ZUZ4_9LAMI|nr:unnamed protein product [Fraxinus pennsylvanica]
MLSDIETLSNICEVILPPLPFNQQPQNLIQFFYKEASGSQNPVPDEKTENGKEGRRIEKQEGKRKKRKKKVVGADRRRGGGKTHKYWVFFHILISSNISSGLQKF